MKPEDFIPESYSSMLNAGSKSWKAPSNIALVKYWGKRDPQLPENPSVSFTLSNCVTRTVLSYEPKEETSPEISFELWFDGAQKASFRPKIVAFFEKILPYQPFLTQYHFRIETNNTFPHSSGIASSASGMAALALCLMAMERELAGEMEDSYFYRKASFLARLGSGSASRSIAGPVVVWGEHPSITGSSDLYAVRYPGELHPVFRDYHDTILLVDKGEKQVSSTVGHQLMHGHPYARERFAQARDHMEAFREVFASGDLDRFVQLVEREALALHAMMLTSDPSFILMRPNTLELLERIRRYREESGTPICFTLDAGANVHLLYPDAHAPAVHEFIESELAGFCQQGQFIHDRCGTGASVWQL